MKKSTIMAVVLAVAAAAAQTATAALPAFTYQGVVTDISGTPLRGNKIVEFRLYTEATGGTPVWGRARSVLLDANGLFNAEISDDGSKLDDTPDALLANILAENANVPLYLGITVENSSGEISPRQKLLSAPYAIHASDALKASGDFSVEGTTTLKGALIVKGEVTMNGEITAQAAHFNGDISTAGSIKAADFEGYGVVPLRCVLMWSGQPSDIPDGWALCNGQAVNGIVTPDLRGRFVVGIDNNDSDYYPVGSTGGEKTHKLTVDEIPSHKHNNRCRTEGYVSAFNSTPEVVTFDGHSNDNGFKDIMGDSTGGDQPHENRPPYYAICFIMRVR